MTIRTTTDPNQIKTEGDDIVILNEDKEWMKELAGNIRKCTDRTIVREAEHDFHEEMVSRYGGKVAGELLIKLWMMCK